MRAYNERLILYAIRTGGPMSKAELARVTGLSAQAASVIVKGLVADGMLVENEKVRGRIGQPMTPLALNPDAAFSVGVKIGRRSVEAVLVDFAGNPVTTFTARHAAPLREPAMARAREGVERMLARLDPAGRARVVGLGVAMPGHIHQWAVELGLAPGALDDWVGADPAAELGAANGLVGQPYNDATAACAAELSMGNAAVTPNMLYIFLGAFVGGGVVVAGRLRHGGRGNAGAIGSMPMLPEVPGERPRQLVHEASLVFLEALLAARGLDPERAIAGTLEDPAADAVFDAWLARAAPALARCAVSAASVIDIETVVIDGMLNPRWRKTLCDRVHEAGLLLDRSGLADFTIQEGTLGARARVLGAAILPLHARFSPRPERLVAEPGEGSEAEMAAEQRGAVLMQALDG